MVSSMECLACSNIPVEEEIAEGKEISFDVSGIGTVVCKISRFSRGFIRGVAKIRDTYRDVEIWYNIVTRTGQLIAY